jgi:hypothetical protein
MCHCAQEVLERSPELRESFGTAAVLPYHAWLRRFIEESRAGLSITYLGIPPALRLKALSVISQASPLLQVCPCILQFNPLGVGLAAKLKQLRVALVCPLPVA